MFLDRDGVINRALVRDGRPEPPLRLEDFDVFEECCVSVARLRRAGFAVVVVTNQPDVARGIQAREVVESMHDDLKRQLNPDAIVVCYHDDADGCHCRKPEPGMLEDSARDLSLDLDRSFMVGDRWRDVEAGRRAGCRTIFVDRQYQEQRPDRPDAVVDGIAEAVDWILETTP